MRVSLPGKQCPAPLFNSAATFIMCAQSLMLLRLATLSTLSLLIVEPAWSCLSQTRP